MSKLKTKITKLITQENKGQSIARNVGIKEAKGEYIVILDSDDFYESTFCQKAIDLFTTDSNIKIITCYANLIYDNEIRDVFKPKGGDITNFLLSNDALGTSLFKKEE